MHDIKAIRQSPEAFDAALARRNIAPRAEEILKLDEAWREMLARSEGLKKQKNELAASMGKVQGKPTPEQMENIRLSQSFGRDIKELEEKLPLLERKINEILSTISNLASEDVPEGKDEQGNKEIRLVGSKPVFPFAPKQHDDLGEALSIMDFERAAHISGARFVFLKGALARMERALASLFLDMNTAAGYTEIVPPFITGYGAMYGTGQMPKFKSDLFLAGRYDDILQWVGSVQKDPSMLNPENLDNSLIKGFTDYWLIPTSEVPLTNMVNGCILEEEKLPIRMTAYTPCFRSEAGAAGKDTRGMIRQHQFSKVEMVSITTPEQSKDEHERMTAQAEAILKKLGLHYRVVLLCTGDMGFSAEKTYDIEVWMPGQNAYREISSCSNCGAFQARRMKARFKRGKENIHVHTLNGSGLPIGRTMVAIIENYQQADGSIAVPEALQPYMGGLKVIA